MRWLALFLVLAVGCNNAPTPSPNSTKQTPAEAFKAYAAKKLGVTPEQLTGGRLPETQAAAYTVGRLWPYAFHTSVGGDREVTGWAMPDGRVVSADENLGLLFDEARIWGPGPTPIVDHWVLAALVMWSTGDKRMMGSDEDNLPGPSLDRQRDGSGQLVFTTSPNASGADLVTNTVTLRPNHTATLARVPR